MSRWKPSYKEESTRHTNGTIRRNSDITMKAAPNTLLFLSPLEEVKTFGILVEGKGYLILFLSEYCQTANDVHIIFWYHFSRLSCNVVRDVPALGSHVYHEVDRTVHGAAQQRGFPLGGAYARDRGCTLGMATKV